MVVDVSNSPSFEDAAVLEFFETSTRNILDAEAATGVGHHVALSVVGAERLPESGYMRAKIAQEKLIKNSSIPYTIVHATQFFEFGTRIADDASDGDTVRVPPVLIQPMAAEDVAAAVCDVALDAPLNDTIEVGGPEPLRIRGLRAARVALRGGSTRRGRRSSSTVLRGPAERAHPRAGGGRAARGDPIRRLAQPGSTSSVILSGDPHASPASARGPARESGIGAGLGVPRPARRPAPGT